MTNKISMPYLSPSRVAAFENCGYNFYLKYLEKSKPTDETTDFYAKYGTLFHDIAELGAKGKIGSFGEAIKYYDKKFMSCGIPDDLKPDYYQRGIKGIKGLYNELEGLDIVGVEKEFKVSLDFTTPPLYGFIDLIYRDSKGRLIVRDYKTSRTFGKTEMGKAWQPYFYTLACKHLYGEYPHIFEFDFVRFGDKRQVIVDENFIKMSEIKIKGVWKRMQESEFRAEFNHFFCSAFCSFRSTCALYLYKNGGI